MPTTYGNDIVYCLKSHCGVRGYCRQKWVLQVQIICKFSNERTCKRNKDVQGLSCGFEINKKINRMKETLRHVSWASAILMMKAADGLPQKRFHQIILSLVVVLALMPAVNVQADLFTPDITYKDNVTQLFDLNGKTYEVTYTNLISNVDLVSLAYDYTHFNISYKLKSEGVGTASSLYTKSGQPQYSLDSRFQTSDLPTEFGQIKNLYTYKNDTYAVSSDNPVAIIRLVARLSFNANGGTGTMEDMAIDNTSRPLSYNTFERTGYTFAGWSTSPTGTKEYADEAMYTGTTNVTLYAKWTAKQYQVTLYDQQNTTITVTYDSDMPTLSALPTKGSYTFDGYYLDVVKYYNADGTSARTWNVDDKATLFAKWQSNPIITLNYENGSATTTQESNYGKAFAQPTDPTRAGYTFEGWYTTADYSGSAFDFSTVLTSDLTLYAKWEIAQYTITYALDGGTNAASNPLSYKMESADIILTPPTKTGYTFAGWTGTGLSAPTISVTIPKGSTGDRAYTATWTINNYTVTFNTNGDTEVANQTVSYGGKVAQPASQTRTGYTFGGWFSDNVFANAYDFTTSTVTGDLTLYAKWTPYTYTIRFHSNDGTGNTVTQTINYDEETALTSNTFTKAGFGISKWTTAADGTGTSYIDGQKVLNLSSTDGEVIDLYAQWQNGVNYVNVTVSGGKVSTSSALCTSYQTVTSSTSAMSDGWYVVNSDVTVSGHISLTGTVNLLLCDGCTFTVSDGIGAGTLNIYGQTHGTGALKASSSTLDRAGIGGTSDGESGGSITINGGTITAKGGELGAGIGGATLGGAGSITINHGTVNATAGSGAAAIGGGHYGQGGTITINGGTTVANSDYGAAIGNGGDASSEEGAELCTVTINGGTVTAQTTGSGDTFAAAGIGSGYQGTGCQVIITGGTIVASSSHSNGTGIGNGYLGSGTTLVITGGNIKAAMNITPTNGSANGSQKLNGITETSLADALSLTAKETKYTYNLTDETAAIDGNYYVWLPLYKVTWKNGDGSILKDEYLDYGATISYDGTPTLNLEGLTTTFKAWSPALSSGTTVTSNVVYTATYDATLNLPTRTIDGATYYEISKRADWDAFSTAVNVISNSIKGIMTADVDLGTDQTMVGTSSSPYAGIFDGNGKTLTINYTNNTSEYTAPFRYVNGATVKNLKVSGAIATDQKYAGGFIGLTKGSTNILNCHSDVTINSTVSGDGTHGGLVGNLSEGTTTVNNCLFTGAINGSSTSCCGGFVGWRNGTLNASNSLNACTYTVSSDGGATFSRNGGTFTNSYYVNENGTAQGTPKTAAEIAATATMASLLQGSQTDEEYWIADPTQTAYPMLKCFAKAAQVTKSDNLAATYYNTLAWTIPSGMKVYTVNSATSGFANATEYTTGTVVPAGTAVVISGDTGDYQLNFDRTSAVSAVSGYLLRGSDLSATTAGDHATKTYSFYKLSLDANGATGSLGFYYGATGGVAFTSNAHKAYLPISSQGGTAKGYILSFGDEPTGISSLPDDTTESGAWYTISGIRLSKKPTTGGLYINNGKKVIIK